MRASRLATTVDQPAAIDGSGWLLGYDLSIAKTNHRRNNVTARNPYWAEFGFIVAICFIINGIALRSKVLQPVPRRTTTQ